MLLSFDAVAVFAVVVDAVAAFDVAVAVFVVVIVVTVAVEHQ